LFAGIGADVVVIDTGNYYPQQRDGRSDDIENGMPESRWVERQLGRTARGEIRNGRWLSGIGAL